LNDETHWALSFYVDEMQYGLENHF